MQNIWFEIFVILGLILANGVFALSEIAIVSARKARLQAMAEDGDERAAAALRLANSPGRFLSTVQVGITLVGTFAGAVGGAKIADNITGWLGGFAPIAPYAELAGVSLVVVVITYLSVVIGELVPKRLALNAPEKLALVMAGPMQTLASVGRPVIWVLEKSGDLLLRFIGAKKVEEPPVSEEEVRVLIDQGTTAGVFKKGEAKMVESVLDLDELNAGDLMTPRARIIWLQLEDKDEENWRKIAGSGHSHFPVFSKNRDNVVGMVSVKSLWANLSLAGKADLRTLLTQPLYIPASMPAAKLFEEFKRSAKHIALVVDEFGVVQGLITLHDLLEAIVGQMPEKEQARDPQARRREDGSWLVDALLETEACRQALGIEDCFPGEEEGAFRTVGGFILRRLGHIPKEGERILWDGFVFEVVDMDKQRIDKLLIHPPKPPAGDLAGVVLPKEPEADTR